MGRLLVDESERIQEDLHKIMLPLLIMHGENDVAAPREGSEIVYDGVRSEDKQLLVWDNMGHEILNEVERHKVFDVMVECLTRINVFSWGKCCRSGDYLLLFIY